MFLSFSASVSFSQLPLSPVSFHFGPHLVRVADGGISGRQDDDIGRSHLETQQAIGQICDENRPTLVLIIPFSCFLQLLLSPVRFLFGPHLVFLAKGNMSGPGC